MGKTNWKLNLRSSLEESSRLPKRPKKSPKQKKKKDKTKKEILRFLKATREMKNLPDGKVAG